MPTKFLCMAFVVSSSCCCLSLNRQHLRACRFKSTDRLALSIEQCSVMELCPASMGV